MPATCAVGPSTGPLSRRSACVGSGVQSARINCWIAHLRSRVRSGSGRESLEGRKPSGGRSRLSAASVWLEPLGGSAWRLFVPLGRAFPRWTQLQCGRRLPL